MNKKGNNFITCLFEMWSVNMLFEHEKGKQLIRAIIIYLEINSFLLFNISLIAKIKSFSILKAEFFNNFAENVHTGCLLVIEMEAV